ncbi:hypothetical protein [Streptomyces zhihengii]|uniref:Uncharacterized protein n=1 Tax=Streptomyces zhihengii TaxID=1818004 RepID=A0ABS2V3R6_9ACTN|nr:hypothetical protein [Streptomyces zhihengii]MBM9624476.1 hypothetical protein [Streptomyces zhihengii]
MADEKDPDWASILRFDQERCLENCKHDAGAAERRGDVSLRDRLLLQAAQLEMLPRLWEFGVQLTEDEYQDAQRVRSWLIHEQGGGAHGDVLQRQRSGSASDVRYYWSTDGYILYVTTARQDGRYVANHRFLTPEWAELLRETIPELGRLVTHYEANQAAGRGHEGIDDTFRMPLDGVTPPAPLRLWCERVKRELQRRAERTALRSQGMRADSPAGPDAGYATEG